MECNKDEALRARQIAESKMQSGDFEGGQKFALKAKNMYAEVENIAQILTVCEVHIAAKDKLCGGPDMDWYKILRTGPFSDDATIKKQYRKLALLLHPDKNKFAGAEAAFKLIGEANRVLGDKENRSLYDMKYKASLRLPKATKTSTYHSNENAFAAKHNANGTNYRNNYFSNSTFSNAHQKVEPQILWTSCKHCNAKCQYVINILDATLNCPKCLNSFRATNFEYQDTPQVFPREYFVNKWKEAPKNGVPKPASESNGGHADNFVPVSMKKCAGSGVGGHRKGKKTIADYFATDRAKGNVPASEGAKEMGSRSPTNVGSKRVRQTAPDSGDSFNAEVGDGNKDSNAQDPSRLNARRSSRKKPHVSYVETGVDDDPSPQKPQKNTNEYEAVFQKKSKDEQFHVQKETSKLDHGLRTSKEEHNAPSDTIHCPDAEFSDFEKDKTEDCFAANQVWAIYDPTEAMPRFYALIKKKVASPFKLQITWLEADPDDQGEVDWLEAGLPVACGKFCLGLSQNTTDLSMFSHQMHWMKGSDRRSYLVYPKKGETWAIFRDWDIKWSSNPEMHSKIEYEYVEILSDFTNNVGIEIAYLNKVKGFVSIFERIEKNGMNKFHVLPNQLYRFSHRVPSQKMSGNERAGVPTGSYELDPAAMPINLFEADGCKL